MNTKHTPGPWQFTATDPVEGGERYWITACPASNRERELGTVSGPQNARNEANARLIAAAPDLLKIALWAVEYDGGECLGDHPNRLAFARAAIAKAEGSAAENAQSSTERGEAHTERQERT